MRGLLDGHIVLSRKIAARNQYPAIDVLESTSRVMRAVVGEDHDTVARTVREVMATYEDARDLIAAGAYRTGTDRKIDAAVSAWPAVMALLKQRPVESREIQETATRLQGVVQLLSGRLSFFTTSFRLDRRVPNVAVFTPSMGLIPYVDVALVSRVSDSVSLGTENNTLSTNAFDTNGTGALAAGGQLRLVKVTVEASGAANRLADNFTLRSSPPMPEAQLLGLIGGNSLAGLSSSGGGAALAAVLGQSLLTPVIGTLTDSLSGRLQFALYPTYVSPEIKDSQERVPGRVPPQLAVVTELGVDLSDRFNFSLITAPNRDDIPPQGTLSYQINSNLSLNGSFDNQGVWQSQFQVFFRF